MPSSPLRSLSSSRPLFLCSSFTVLCILLAGHGQFLSSRFNTNKIQCYLQGLVLTCFKRNLLVFARSLHTFIVQQAGGKQVAIVWFLDLHLHCTHQLSTSSWRIRTNCRQDAAHGFVSGNCALSASSRRTDPLQRRPTTNCTQPFHRVMRLFFRPVFPYSPPVCSSW